MFFFIEFVGFFFIFLHIINLNNVLSDISTNTNRYKCSIPFNSRINANVIKHYVAKGERDQQVKCIIIVVSTAIASRPLPCNCWPSNCYALLIPSKFNSPFYNGMIANSKITEIIS